MNFKMVIRHAVGKTFQRNSDEHIDRVLEKITLQESIKGYSRRLVTCVSFISEACRKRN